VFEEEEEEEEEEPSTKELITLHSLGLESCASALTAHDGTLHHSFIHYDHEYSITEELWDGGKVGVRLSAGRGVSPFRENLGFGRTSQS
jgi:hypothetical protein